MGLTDLATKVLTEYKADISDHKAKLKELTGEEKALMEQTIKSAEAQNVSYDSVIGKLGQLGLAMNTVKELGKVAFDLFEDHLQRLKLESTAAGASIDGLSKAAGGLKTQTELLEHAAKFNKSAFQLTQEQMETAEAAMRALEARGVPAAEAFNAVGAAVTKGVTRPLEQFGIIIDKTGLAIDEQGFKLDTHGARLKAVGRIYDALTGLTKETASAQLEEAEGLEKVGVKFRDMWDHMKDGLGRLVIQMAPFLDQLQKVSASIGSIAAGASKLGMFSGIFSNNPIGEGARGAVGGFWGAAGDAIDYANAPTQGELMATLAYQRSQKLLAAVQQQMRAFNAEAPGALGSMASGATKGGTWDSLGEKMSSAELKKQEQEEIEAEARRILRSATMELGGGGTRGGFINLDKGGKVSYGYEGRGSVAYGGMGAAAGEDAYRDDAGHTIDGLDLQGAQTAILTKNWKDMTAGWAKEDKPLEKMFGPVSDFDVYHKAFEALGGAVKASLGAWIDGSMSAGQAIKGFLAETMKGEALSMAAEALKATAWGIFYAADGDPRAAGKFVAAAEFGLAATAFAIGAKELGGGGGHSTSSGAGATGTGYGPSGGSGAGSAPPWYNGSGPPPGSSQTVNANKIIVIGDDFSGQSLRMQQLNAARIVKLAQGSNAVQYG